MMRRGWLVAVCAAALAGGWLSSSMATAADLPAAPELLRPRIDEIETQIASRIVRRPNTALANQVQLEMEIDLRVIARWMLQQALDAPAGGDVQVAAFLRSMQLLEVIDGFQQTLSELAGRDIAQSQLDAMKRLHELSFALPAGKTVGGLDDVSAKTATALYAIVRPGADVRKLASVRPRPDRAAAGGDDPSGELSRLEASARQATVSVPLRQQLLALWAAADEARRDPKRSNDAAALLEALRTAVGLARGLESNTGVSPEQRQAIQDHLLEGLALYMDPRTRSAGQSRIEALGAYQRLLDRVDGLGLTPEQRVAVGPVLTAAQRDPKSAGRLLGALRIYADVVRRLSVMDKQPNRLQNLRNADDALRQRFQTKSEAFLDLAGRRGGRFDATPEALETSANALRDIMDTLDAIAVMPHALDALLEYKPKNYASLERRILVLAATASKDDEPGADAAARDLRDLATLTRLADGLASASATESPIKPIYLGNAVETLDGRWRAAVADQASAFSGGGSIDGKVLRHMDWLTAVYHAISDAKPAEMAAAKTAVLSRWVDWRLTPASAETVLTPYRRGTADFAAGLFQGADDKAFDEWSRLRRRYAPIHAFFARAGRHLGEAEAMPTGFEGQAAQLLTPMDERDFQAERWGTVAMTLWASKVNNNEDAQAEAAGAVVAAKLAEMLGMPYREESLNTPRPNRRGGARSDSRQPGRSSGDSPAAPGDNGFN